MNEKDIGGFENNGRFLPIFCRENWDIATQALAYLFLGDKKNTKINFDDKKKLNFFFSQDWSNPWEIKIKDFFLKELNKIEEKKEDENENTISENPIEEAYKLKKKLFNEEMLLKQYFSNLFEEYTQIFNQETISLVEKKIDSIFQILLELKDRLAECLYTTEFVSTATMWQNFGDISNKLLLYMDDSLLSYLIWNGTSWKKNEDKEAEEIDFDNFDIDSYLEKIEENDNIIYLNFNLQKIFTHLHKYDFLRKHIKNLWSVHNFLKHNKKEENKLAYVQKYSSETILKNDCALENIDFLIWSKTSYVEKTQFFINNSRQFIDWFSSKYSGDDVVKMTYDDASDKSLFYEKWKLNHNKKIDINLINNQNEKKTSFDELYDFEIFTIVEKWEESLMKKHAWDNIELLEELKKSQSKEKPISNILENYVQKQWELYNKTKEKGKEWNLIQADYNKVKRLSSTEKLEKKSKILSKFKIKWKEIRSFDLFSKFDTNFEYPDLVLQDKNENMQDSLFSKLSSLFENKPAFLAYLKSEWVDFDEINDKEMDEIMRSFLAYMDEIKSLENEIHKKLERKDSEWRFNGLVKAVGMLTGASIRTEWVTDMSGEWAKYKKDGDLITAEHLTQSKSYTRAMDKLVNTYDWDMKLFNDAKRATLEYASLPEWIWAMKKFIDVCALDPNVEELIMVDKFGKVFERAPKASGYRDFKFIVKFKADKDGNQESAELMFHISPILKTKLYGHKIGKNIFENIGIGKDVKNPDTESMDIIEKTINNIKKLKNKVAKPSERDHKNLLGDEKIYEIRRYIIDSLPEILKPIGNTWIKSFELEKLINTEENIDWNFSDKLWDLKKNPEKLDLYRKYLIVIEKLNIISSSMFGAANKTVMKWMWEYYDAINSYKK